jgi:hypothetical protein
MGIRACPDYRVAMNETLGCRFLPSPKRGGPIATTLPAPPAAHPIVHLQVCQRERMPLAARVGYTSRHLERASEQLEGIAEAHDTS